jgi:hypothetical protein
MDSPEGIRVNKTITLQGGTPGSCSALLTIYTDSCVAGGFGGGGVELYCRPYSAGVLHSVSDQIQNLQNCFSTPKK